MYHPWLLHTTARRACLITVYYSSRPSSSLLIVPLALHSPPLSLSNIVLLLSTFPPPLVLSRFSLAFAYKSMTAQGWLTECGNTTIALQKSIPHKLHFLWKKMWIGEWEGGGVKLDRSDCILSMGALVSF